MAASRRAGRACAQRSEHARRAAGGGAGPFCARGARSGARRRGAISAATRARETHVRRRRATSRRSAKPRISSSAGSPRRPPRRRGGELGDQRADARGRPRDRGRGWPRRRAAPAARSAARGRRTGASACRASRCRRAAGGVGRGRRPRAARAARAAAGALAHAVQAGEEAQVLEAGDAQVEGAVAGGDQADAPAGRARPRRVGAEHLMLPSLGVDQAGRARAAAWSCRRRSGPAARGSHRRGRSGRRPPAPGGHRSGGRGCGPRLRTDPHRTWGDRRNDWFTTTHTKV